MYTTGFVLLINKNMASPQEIASTLDSLIGQLKGGIVYGSFGLSVGDETVIPRLKSLVSKIAALQVPEKEGDQELASNFPVHTVALLNAKGLAVPPRGMQDMNSPLQPLDFGLYNSLPRRYLEGRVKISTIGTLLEAVGAGLQARAKQPRGSIRKDLARPVYEKHGYRGPQDVDAVTRIALLNSQLPLNKMGGITDIYLWQNGKMETEQPCLYAASAEYRERCSNARRPRSVCLINDMPISFVTYEINTLDETWQHNYISDVAVVDPNFKYYQIFDICFGSEKFPEPHAGHIAGKRSALVFDQRLFWRIPKRPPYKIEWRGEHVLQMRTGVLTEPEVLKGGKVMVTLFETAHPTQIGRSRRVTMLGPSRTGHISPLFGRLTEDGSPHG